MALHSTGRGRLGRNRFSRSELGAVTFEVIIWLPIFTFIIWLITETAMAFGDEARAIQVIQEGNRLYATGALQSAADTESYVKAQLSAWAPTMTVTTVETNGVVHTTVTVPVTTMTGFDLLSFFSGVNVTVTSEQRVET